MTESGRDELPLSALSLVVLVALLSTPRLLTCAFRVSGLPLALGLLRPCTAPELLAVVVAPAPLQLLSARLRMACATLVGSTSPKQGSSSRSAAAGFTTTCRGKGSRQGDLRVDPVA